MVPTMQRSQGRAWLEPAAHDRTVKPVSPWSRAGGLLAVVLAAWAVFAGPADAGEGIFANNGSPAAEIIDSEIDSALKEFRAQSSPAKARSSQGESTADTQPGVDSQSAPAGSEGSSDIATSGGLSSLSSKAPDGDTPTPTTTPNRPPGIPDPPPLPTVPPTTTPNRPPGIPDPPPLPTVPPTTTVPVTTTTVQTPDTLAYDQAKAALDAAAAAWAEASAGLDEALAAQRAALEELKRQNELKRQELIAAGVDEEDWPSPLVPEALAAENAAYEAYIELRDAAEPVLDAYNEALTAFYAAREKVKPWLNNRP